MEWRVLEEYSRLSLHFTHSIQESAEKRANTVACWEITFVTITIAQSPTVDVIDISLPTAGSRWHKYSRF